MGVIGGNLSKPDIAAPFIEGADVCYLLL